MLPEEPAGTALLNMAPPARSYDALLFAGEWLARSAAAESRQDLFNTCTGSCVLSLLLPIRFQSGNLRGNQVGSFQPRPAASATGRRLLLFVAQCAGFHTHSAIGPIQSPLVCVDRVIAKIALEPDPVESVLSIRGFSHFVASRSTKRYRSGKGSNLIVLIVYPHRMGARMSVRCFIGSASDFDTQSDTFIRRL